MSISMKSPLVAMALAAAVSSVVPAIARAAEPTVEELKQQITELQSRLAAVETKQQQAQQAASDDVARTVAAVAQDAEQRSKGLTLDDGSAGYDMKSGFYIRDADGKFELRPGLLGQFRYITTVTTGDDGDVESGFELRRLRPRLDGYVFSKDLTYSVVFDVNRNNGTTSLLDAWAQYRFTEHWAVKGGQFRNSWVHEGDTPDSNQLAVERSLVDAVLAGSQTDRVQGIALIYGGQGEQPLRFEGTVDDGDNSKNTNFENVNTDFGGSIRGEWRAAGNWADYKDFSARANKKDLLVVGGGADFSESGSANTLRTTVDAQYETTSRWAFYAALNGNFNSDDGDDTFDWGALGQVGYAINQKWEPFVRYDVVVLEDDAGGDDDAYNEFAIGVNYFLGENGSWGNRGKFTFDFLYLPDGAPSDQTGAGVLASDDAEYVFRGQFQLML